MTSEHDALNKRNARAAKKLRLFLCAENPLWPKLTILRAMSGTRLDAPQKGKRRSGPKRVNAALAAGLSTPKDHVTTCLRLLGLSGEWRRQHLAGHIPKPDHLEQRIRGVLTRVQELAKSARMERSDAFKSFDAADPAAEAAKVIDDFLKSYAAHDPVYKAGRALGMGVDACQMALDGILYAQRPFLQAYGASQESRDAANEAFAHLGGVYYAWLRRPDPASRRRQARMYLKCALRVRYVLKLDSGYSLRVKLNVPVVEHRPSTDQTEPQHGDPPLIEYDGFVHFRERCFWVLEERTTRSDGDLISMITTRASGRNGRMAGHYLTVGQEKVSSIVQDALVLERVPAKALEGAPEEDRSRIMRGSMRTVRSGDAEYEGVEALFRQEGHQA
jgi:hypothetical protein